MAGDALRCTLPFYNNAVANRVAMFVHMQTEFIVAQEELIFVRPEHAHWFATIAPFGQIGMSGIVKRWDRYTVEIVEIHDFEALGT